MVSVGTGIKSELQTKIEMSENRILNFMLLYVSFENIKLIVYFWDFIV
jgi:hypothetical protein